MKTRLPSLGIALAMLATAALTGCVTIHNTYTGLPPSTDGATPAGREVARADCGCAGSPSARVGTEPYGYYPPPFGYYPDPYYPDPTYSGNGPTYYPDPYPDYYPYYRYPHYPYYHGSAGDRDGSSGAGTAGSSGTHGIASESRRDDASHGKPTASGVRRNGPVHTNEAHDADDTVHVGSGLPRDTRPTGGGIGVGTPSHGNGDVAHRAPRQPGPTVIGGPGSGSGEHATGGNVAVDVRGGNGGHQSETRDRADTLIGEAATPTETGERVGVRDQQVAPAHTSEPVVKPTYTHNTTPATAPHADHEGGSSPSVVRHEAAGTVEAAPHHEAVKSAPDVRSTPAATPTHDVKNEDVKKEEVKNEKGAAAADVRTTPAASTSSEVRRSPASPNASPASVATPH